MSYDPYAPPQPGAQPPPSLVPRGAQPWEVTEVISEAWRLFKVHVGTVLGAFVVGSTFGAIPGQVPAILELVRVVGPHHPYYWPLKGTFAAVGWVVSTFFNVGLTRITVAVARGQTPDSSLLFSGGDRFFANLACSLLVALVVMLGLFFLIVPGVILSLGLCLSQLFVIDRNLRPFEAMRASWDATRGEKGKIFVFVLACVGVALIGVLACFVGVLAAMPVISIATSILYLRLTGSSATSGPPVAAAPPYPPAGAPPSGYGPSGYGEGGGYGYGGPYAP